MYIKIWDFLEVDPTKKIKIKIKAKKGGINITIIM
jgi:hypothetical protein